MNLNDGHDLLDEPIRHDPATDKAAALHVCSQATSVEDARLMLEMLGLVKP
jgi:hypothetical protein